MMAFTSKTSKGSKQLTQETVSNRGDAYKLMNEIKGINPTKESKLKEELFWTMFEYLSHTAQEDILKRICDENWNAVVSH